MAKAKNVQVAEQPKANKFWKIKNQGGAGTAEIWIYEQIGWDWWTYEGIDAKDLCQEIAALNVQNIDVHIMSPGGSVFDGIAIYNALKRHTARITTYNDGYAASISSVIFCAGDRRVTCQGAILMIHLPTTACDGNADDLRKTADLLDTVRDSLVSVYRTVTTLSDEELITAMEAETYYGAAETVDLGFATELGEELKVAACAKKFDLKALGYRKPPSFLVVDTPVQPKNDISLEITIGTEEEDDPDDLGNPEEQCCYCTGCAPEMACADCPCCETCINSGKDSTDGMKPGMKTSTKKETTASAENTKPQGAKNQEVIVMAEQTVAPAAGVRDFQKDAAEIVGMCLNSGCPGKAQEFISAGFTPGDVGIKILDLMHSGAIHTPAAEAGPIVDMGKEASKYSYARAIATMANMREKNIKPSGFEWDIHQELLGKVPDTYVNRGGILIPQRVNAGGDPASRNALAQATMMLRNGNTVDALRILNTALTTSGTNTGKETVFQEYGEFIDILRNMMVTTRMGARVLTGLKGPITFPKQTGASTLVWNGENPGSDVAGSNVTFSTVPLTPKTCQAQGALSRQLIIESTPDVEGIVRNDLAMIHALGWDLAALHGTGANNQPTGLYNLSGVNVKAMGGVPTYGKLVDMVTAVATYNALMGTTGFVTNPLMAGLLMQTLDFPTASGRPIWQGKHTQGIVAGYDAIASNQVSATLGAGAEVGMLFGNWDDLMIGMWGALEILVDPYTLAGQGLLKLTSFQMIDIAARRAQSFTKTTGATLT